MQGFMIRDWGLILPGRDATSTSALQDTPAARWLDDPQPTSNQPVGLGFPHRAKRYRPGRFSFSSPACGSCRDMETFLIRDKTLCLPVSGATSTLARGATLAACWLHDPQPNSNQRVELRLPHRAGRYRPWGSPFVRPRVVGVVEIWKDFWSGDNLILPVSGATSPLARETTLAVRWPHEPQSISIQPVELGLPHRAERYQGISVFVPRLFELRKYEGISYPGMGPCPPRVRRDLDVGPRGNSRRVLGP